MPKYIYVYLLASRSGCIYVGITRNIRRRWIEHRLGKGPVYVQRNNVRDLVHVERFPVLRDALKREKRIKGWRRSKKVALIEAHNPDWRDLGLRHGWPEPTPDTAASALERTAAVPSMRVVRGADGPRQTSPAANRGRSGSAAGV